MFLTTVVLHSLLRWAVLVFGLLAIGRALQGWLGRRPWTPLDDRAGKFFVISLDVQTLVGLVLYGVLSPITRAAFADMGVAMKDAFLRFYAIEHLVMMIIGLAVVHVGRARTRKAPIDSSKHLTAAVFFGIGLVMILAGIPWPGRAVGRPLLPSF